MLMKLERKLVAQKEQGVTHVIVIENEQVVEYLTDQGAEAAYPGALYKGHINKILSKWKAALVDIGQNKPLSGLKRLAGVRQSQTGQPKREELPLPQPGESIIVPGGPASHCFKRSKSEWQYPTGRPLPGLSSLWPEDQTFPSNS